jgi:hypothetical protein
MALCLEGNVNIINTKGQGLNIHPQRVHKGHVTKNAQRQ